MLLILFQYDLIWILTIVYIMIIAFIVGLILLKVGLVISKAETRTGFKWVLGSFGIQVGMFFFVGSPLILLGISGAFGEQGPEIILIIIFLVLALFIEINLLNIIHRLGILRALLVFGLMVVPFLFVSFSVIVLVVVFS